MMRSKRELYVEALKILLQGKMSSVVKARDWELLKEVAQLASQDAPADLAVTDPALFQSWRAAVTRFHLRGWTNMTPERVESFQSRQEASANARPGPSSLAT
jgi:hypothetical protein